MASYGSDQELIKIDPDGDLVLIVGSTKTRFLVCSKTLSRSAPFWKRCLYGPFREAEPADGRPWEVGFPEDNPSAMNYVLLLAHAMGHRLPKINLQLAFEVTVLTNKYDMTRVLWAVARTWAEDMRTIMTVANNTVVARLQLLWVWRELGDIEQYSLSFAALSQTVSTSDEHQNMLSLRLPHIPDDDSALTRESIKGYDAEKDVILLVADDIKSARWDALERIQGLLKLDIRVLKSAIRAFDSSKGCEGSYICAGQTSHGDRVPPNKRRFCEYAMQAIIAKISDEQGSAVRPASMLGISAEEYLANAVRFTSRINREIALVCGDEHKRCTPFKNKLPDRLDLLFTTESKCAAQNRQAFEKQARISGLKKGGEIDDNEDQGGSGRKRSRREFEGAAQSHQSLHKIRLKITKG